MLETVNSETLRQVGRSPVRSDAPDKLTGAAIYVSDMTLPGMLYAQVKKSPHARARIKRIDTSHAERLTGVRAVLTGHDLDYKMGLYVVDKDILAKNEVRHFGEAVAAVAADTLAIAHQAVELIEVDYEVLRPVLNHMDALAPDAPLVHPDLGSYDYVKAVFSPHPGTNIANLTVTRKGDVEKGFAEAEWIVEREYTNPSVQHVPMETHVAIAQWKTGDRVDIWSSAQSPFTVRGLFCHAFKLPLNNVRVVDPQRRRRFRRQGGHRNRAAGRLPLPQGGRQAGEVPGDARRGVQPAAVPQRADLPHQDRRARRRPHHRAEDGDVLGRRRLRRLCGERHPRLGLFGRRPLRDSQRLGRRLHPLHQQALRHGVSRLRPRRVLLGPRAAHGAGRADHRHGSVGVPQEEPAQAGFDHPDRREDHRAHRRHPQVPRFRRRRDRLWRADSGGEGARGEDRPEDRQRRRHPAQGAGDAVHSPPPRWW